MRACLILAAALVSSPALAGNGPSPRIVVSGAATVLTPPDRAVIRFGVHGEGSTSDEAVSAMVARRKAIDGGIALMAGHATPIASQVAVAEVRGRDCNRNGYAMPKLSTGECAVVGYTADLSMEVRISTPKDAGTLVGLIGRLGGMNPHVDQFVLADDAPARARALAAALADARIQAEAIAAGAKVPLGRILSISNGTIRPGAEDVVVTGTRNVPPPPAPPAPPPPIAVGLTPRPIDTQARVTVVYAIGP